MRFGFHISIAGGFSKVVERALLRKSKTIQFFSRNPRGWNYNPLNKGDINEFKRNLQKTDISPVFVHMPYLPNLASPSREIFDKSLQSLMIELKRTEQIGAQFLIMHIGSRLESGEDTAIERVSNGINKTFNKVDNSVILLLENTAGMGSEIGNKFSQIKEIFDRVKDKDRLGVVLDTAHVFEAGYPIHNKQGLDYTLKEFDHLIGLKRLHVLHLNDSKTDLNSQVDRHWHIGEGKIGLEGFRRIVNHPLFKHLPAIMETPKKDEKDDFKNMRVVKSLVEE
ncbi:MAG: deoxyribonuclease IV [Candidatus Latescibacteria bacterium]|nr:deoxyribonuclease IV [Candidatus Latescibacterota bacterium]